MALLLVKDVARILDLSSDRIRQLECAGRLRSTRTLSGVRVFEESTIREFARRRVRRGRKPGAAIGRITTLKP